MNEQESSRAKQAWTYALIMLSVVALVIAVAGLLRPSPDPELTTVPTTSTPEPDPGAPVENNTAQEPVNVSAPIPGCETVLPPTEPILSAFTSSAEPSYDNPKFPWFSGPKATAMSNAVADQLPEAAEIEFASPMQSLIFQPIDDYGESAPEFNGITIATGSVVNGDARGGVTVQVHQSSSPIPPCVAGNLDERRTLQDGTLVDVHDTWHEVNGVRSLIRTAQAYATDGTWIHANSSDAFTTTQQENSGKIPLTIDDLVRIVGDPGLRVSTPVPPGTPAPPEGCGDSFDDGGPAITREQARRLDTILATTDLRGRKLPPLQLANYSDDIVCTDLSVSEVTAGLKISITGGQPLPTPERPVPGSSGQREMRTLPDGTVVQTQQSSGSVSTTSSPDNSQRETTNSVEVTRPGGTQISVSSSAAVPNSPLSLEELESIALTDGLEL